MFYVNFFSRKVEVSNLCENKTIIMQREHFPPLYNFASFWPPMLLCFFVSEQNVDKFFSSGWICEVILQFCRYYLILIRSLSCQKHEIFFLHMWTCECPELENNFQLSLAESYNFFEQNLDQNQGHLFLFHHNIRSIYLDFRFCEMNYYCHIKCVLEKMSVLMNCHF